MSWGIEIYEKGKPIKITGRSFIFNQIAVTQNGSKTYNNIPKGRSLAAYIVARNRGSYFTVKVENNKISWNSLRGSQSINGIIMVLIK